MSPDISKCYHILEESLAKTLALGKELINTQIILIFANL